MNSLFHEITNLPTEQKNPTTATIDLMDIREILEVINREDAGVAAAVREQIPQIERAVELIVAAFRAGGRLIYVGAGTSGRLGILDAAECPPTFGSGPEQVRGLIAGGPQAVFTAQEGAEDDPTLGAADVRSIQVSSSDVVCGLAASGRTPYVVGALAEAKSVGAGTVLVSTGSVERIRARGIRADVLICPQVGPEAIAGSTRMKSGTAQKMTLNMLTTAAMIRMGKTYGNVMVDLQLNNNKLQHRASHVVMECADVDYETANRMLAQADGHVKTALVALLANVSVEEARIRLQDAGGFVRLALQPDRDDEKAH